MRVRTIYLVKDAEKNGAVIRPRVSIERTSSGGIAIGVHVAARSLKQARETAQAEFSALLAYAKRRLQEEEKA